jgi:hypothetical protein
MVRLKYSRNNVEIYPSGEISLNHSFGSTNGNRPSLACGSVSFFAGRFRFRPESSTSIAEITMYKASHEWAEDQRDG